VSKAVAAATMPPVLARLVGDWAGAGWSRHRPGQRPRPLAQTEAVRSHLDGLLLTVEGCGTAAGSAEVVHRAFAVISGAGHGTRLRWTAYVAEGCTDTELTMHPDGFEWPVPGSGQPSPATVGGRPVSNRAPTAAGRSCSPWT